jgi:hypothetical protein
LWYWLKPVYSLEKAFQFSFNVICPFACLSVCLCLFGCVFA